MKLMELLNNKERMRELIFYGIFGLLTTIVSLVSFQLLRMSFINVNETLLNLFSIIISILFAYITNRKFVFRSKERNILKEVTLFFGSRATSTVFEMIGFYILNELIKIDGLISKAIITIFVIILNYIMSKIIVFKKNS